MLNWVSRFNIFCFLDNQSYSIQPHKFEGLLAVGARQIITGSDIGVIDEFKSKHNHDWLFGHLNYELLHGSYALDPGKNDPVGFPSFHFFVPQVLVSLTKDGLDIQADDPGKIFKEIIAAEEKSNMAGPGLSISQKLNRDQYISIIEKLKEHILRGDCYEINFCQEFFAQDAYIDPVHVYQRLAAVSPNPFSVLYRLNDSYLLCASPERYLMKQGKRIISQPIKGTIKRDLENIVEDDNLKKDLYESSKEQAENVMVVDLVRNDLTKVCTESSVQVDELFGIYSFPQVHQMISTISGELKAGVGFSDIIKASFPMGSMTGAPKKRVMQLIDQYEDSPRGIFSGAVGYIDPGNDFDLNVVIRSIMYNSLTHFLCYKLGSGITFYSDAVKEWEECLLKGEAIREVLRTEEQMNPSLNSGQAQELMNRGSDSKK